jgi:antitoxin MazE
MEAKIIKIGNSKGIIIPNEFLKLLQFEEQVNLDIEEEKLVIQSALRKPRENWGSEIRKELEKNGPEKPLIPNLFEDEVLDDWTW